MATSIDISDDLDLRIRHLADARRQSRGQVLQDAVEQYVEREERRETFRQDAMEAWNHYGLTGLHVTEEEAEAWLLRLEGGEDVEPPQCHV